MISPDHSRTLSSARTRVPDDKSEAQGRIEFRAARTQVDARCTPLFFSTSSSQEKLLLSVPTFRREKSEQVFESAIMDMRQ